MTSTPGAANLLPRTTAEWTALVQSALRIGLDELHLPERFFLREISKKRRHSHLRSHMRVPCDRESAVLLLLSPPTEMTVNGFQEMCITLTKRTSKLRHHKNQVSFPGGRVDRGETPIAAAQRETMEEVGISASSYHVIGPLHPTYSFDGHSRVVPLVGIANSVVDPVCKSPDEVASVHYLHISRLLMDSEKTHSRLIKWFSLTREGPVHFPCFFASTSQGVPCGDVHPTPNIPSIPEDAGFLPMLPEDFPGELVWGLTAFVLCEFLLRLCVALERNHPGGEIQAVDLLKSSSVIARDPEWPMGKL